MLEMQTVFSIHVLQIQDQEQDQHPRGLTAPTLKLDHRLFIFTFLQSKCLVFIYNSVSVLFPILLKRSKKFFLKK